MRLRVSFMSISDSSLDTLDADSVDLFAFFPSSYQQIDAFIISLSS